MYHASPIVGPLQLRILEVLWAGCPATVHAVHEALNKQPQPKLAYTTVLTVMRNLVTRNFLTVTRGARRHVFAATMTRRAYCQTAARWFMDHIGADASAAMDLMLLSERTAKAGA